MRPCIRCPLEPLGTCFSIELTCSWTSASRTMSRRNSSIMFAGKCNGPGRCGTWGLRAPARCSTVPSGTDAASQGSRLKLTVVRGHDHAVHHDRRGLDDFFEGYRGIALTPRRQGAGRREVSRSPEYFVVHNITWWALPEKFGHWNSVGRSGCGGRLAPASSRSMSRLPSTYLACASILRHKPRWELSDTTREVEHPILFEQNKVVALLKKYQIL
jgi:hypothetical protein